MTVHFDTYRPRFRVERITGQYRIIGPDGAPLDQKFTCKSAAETRCTSMQQEADAAAKRVARPCMCCGRVFESEGIHNRLCGFCRSRDTTDWMTAGTTSTGKVRRAASQP